MSEVGVDWFEATGSHCSGDTSVASAVAALLPTNLVLRSLHPIGNFAIRLSPSELNRVVSDNPHVLSELILTSESARDLRSALRSAAASKIPIWERLPVNLLNDLLIPNSLLNLASGWLLDRFYQLLDTSSLELQSVSQFVAAGGKLLRNMYPLKHEERRFVLSTAEYTVRVGLETRSALLYACIYPIDLVVSQFTAVDNLYHNNKIIRPVGESKWGIWDVTDARWDDSDVEFWYQDPANYYFKQNEYENNIVAGQGVIKISTNGGRYEFKHWDSENFTTRYFQVDLN